MINDQAVIRWMFPACTAKWLSRLMGISLRSARFWAEQTVPVYRREDLGRKLIEEFHKQTKWREEVLFPALCKMAGVRNEVETLPASTIANTAADLLELAAGRIEAAIDWIEGE